MNHEMLQRQQNTTKTLIISLLIFINLDTYHQKNNVNYLQKFKIKKIKCNKSHVLSQPVSSYY